MEKPREPVPASGRAGNTVRLYQFTVSLQRFATVARSPKSVSHCRKCVGEENEHRNKQGTSAHRTPFV
jgi:hypothetical protein